MSTPLSQQVDESDEEYAVRLGKIQGSGDHRYSSAEQDDANHRLGMMALWAYGDEAMSPSSSH